MCLSPRTVLCFLLINTLLVSLLSIFVGILFCKADGPGPCHWPLVEWPAFGALTAVTRPQSLAGNRNSASSCCRPRSPGITLKLNTSKNKLYSLPNPNLLLSQPFSSARGNAFLPVAQAQIFTAILITIFSL